MFISSFLFNSFVAIANLASKFKEKKTQNAASALQMALRFTIRTPNEPNEWHHTAKKKIYNKWIFSFRFVRVFETKFSTFWKHFFHENECVQQKFKCFCAEMRCLLFADRFFSHYFVLFVDDVFVVIQNFYKSAAPCRPKCMIVCTIFPNSKQELNRLIRF